MALRAGRGAGEEPPSPNTYAPRRVYGTYLRDVFARIIGHLPPGVEVRSLQGRARELRRSTDGRYRLCVSNGVELTVDKVVLTTGHPRNRAEDADRDLLDFASRHPRTRYLRGDSAADMDLAGIEPGEPVAVLGLGLTFYDVAALLTTGRGGAFRPGPDGRLRYHPPGWSPGSTPAPAADCRSRPVVATRRTRCTATSRASSRRRRWPRHASRPSPAPATSNCASASRCCR
ncbi:FAD/NAD(P)-binding protein [Streptacidiphilus monticola]